GDPGEAGDPGTGRGAGAACPDLRDARALPSRREARGVSAADETVDRALRSAASGPGAVIEGSRRRTWAELDHAAGEVATALTAAGAAGGRVALRVENTFAHLGAMFGIWRTGGTLVPLNPRLTAGEVANLSARARVVAEL